MTNAEKFTEVFGTDLKRQYSTKSWWEQEFVPNKESPTEAETDNKCQECKKDWTKCTRCPVMMKWVVEMQNEASSTEAESEG